MAISVSESPLRDRWRGAKVTASASAADGFRVEAVTRFGKRFSVQYVANTLAHWLERPLLKSVAQRLEGSRLGKIGVRINLRDNVFVLARRVD